MAATTNFPAEVVKKIKYLLEMKYLKNVEISYL